MVIGTPHSQTGNNCSGKMSGCGERTRNSTVKWRSATERLPNAKGRSRTPKGRSRIWQPVVKVTARRKNRFEPFLRGTKTFKWASERRYSAFVSVAVLPLGLVPEMTYFNHGLLARQLALHKRNSTNSSKPPSSDGLAGEQRPCGRKHKSKRNPGGQPGHHRELVPTAEVSAIEVVLPQQCRHCGNHLPQKPSRVTIDGESRRHQVTEIPAVKAHITEYQFPNVVCGSCGKATRAPLPEEIAGRFGPQLTALIAYWTVVCRLPRRLVEAMLADVLGIEISLGSTQKAWEEISQAVEQPVCELQAQLPREAVLNVDATGWRTNGDKRWIWALVANQFVFYAVASNRSAEVLVSLLGAVFRGILCSDRWVVI